MSTLSNVGNICKACELDCCDPRKMLKRKGGIAWLVIGIVLVLALIKVFASTKTGGETQEIFMHEVDLPLPKNEVWKFRWQDRLLAPKLLADVDGDDLANIPQEEFEDGSSVRRTICNPKQLEEVPGAQIIGDNEEFVVEMEPMQRTICNPRQLLCERRRDPLFDGLHKIDAQELTHRVMTKATYKCRGIERFGSVGQGGYEVCLDKSYAFKKNKCLVYSFGLSAGQTFEQAISDQYGCEIHSFDPAVELKSEIKGNITYHNIGLWGDDFENSNGWQMKKFSSIVKYLGHENRVIDLVKMDGRGAEWPFFRDIAMDPSPLDRVKQFIFDAYAPRRKPKKQIMRMTDYAQVFRSISLIKRLGFRNFWHHGADMSQSCCNWWADLVPPQVSGADSTICCYQVFLVNMNYL